MEKNKNLEKYYEKIPFVWEQPKPLIRVSQRLKFRSLDNVRIAAFIDTVS